MFYFWCSVFVWWHADAAVVQTSAVCIQSCLCFPFYLDGVYAGKVKYCFELKNIVILVLPDDLASKANIIIDPAEIQAASMDDLDEDEESGAAQVFFSFLIIMCVSVLLDVCVHIAGCV